MNIKARIAALVAASLLSIAGFTHIKLSEGIHTVAYPDPGTGGAPWTICYGHTGPEVVRGLRVSMEQCELWLLEDTLKAEAVIKKTITRPMKQGEYDAAVSFIYNVGEGNWRKSTLLRSFNAGDRVRACNEYPKWIYANKRVLEGLRVRRYKEQAMCLTQGAYIYDPSHR